MKFESASDNGSFWELLPDKPLGDDQSDHASCGVPHQTDLIRRFPDEDGGDSIRCSQELRGWDESYLAPRDV
ncbi:MAG: hypothetical protein P1U87_08385 [Verrucomicrobiales bacterium]|nr:hypothetical protein [Verrucomicrobiales bacterium]